MPFLAILTIFGVLVGLEGCAVLVCALVPRLRGHVRNGVRVIVGSSFGFVAGNLASLAIGVVPVLVGSALAIDRDDPRAQVVAAFALAGFFVGPLVASPLGILGGAWLALRSARRTAVVPLRTDERHARAA